MAIHDAGRKITKKRSEAGLTASSLDWTRVYPAGLTDAPPIEAVEVRPTNEAKKIEGLPQVSRAKVAKVLLDAAEDGRGWTSYWAEVVGYQQGLYPLT